MNLMSLKKYQVLELILKNIYLKKMLAKIKNKFKLR